MLMNSHHKSAKWKVRGEKCRKSEVHYIMRMSTEFIAIIMVLQYSLLHAVSDPGRYKAVPFAVFCHHRRQIVSILIILVLYSVLRYKKKDLFNTRIVKHSRALPNSLIGMSECFFVKKKLISSKYNTISIS